MLSRYWTRRLLRHVTIFVASAFCGGALWLVIPTRDNLFRWSVTSAYVSLVLLAVTLVVGPVNVIRRRPNPVSTDLRRDLGIWSGVTALVHVVAGLQVHLRGHMWQYFLTPDLPHLPRHDAFGLSNYSGLAAAGLLVLLLTISSDRALGRLGTNTWKRVQRWAYAAGGLVVVHGALYQFIEKRDGLYSAVLSGVTLAIGVGQWLGYRRVRATASLRLLSDH
jgi:methionine sulfoxide reductase heme-binding subunit